MGYEKYVRQSTRVEELTLSVSSAGKIALNVAAGRIFQANGIKCVVILWDKKACKIALKAAKTGDKDAYSASFGRGWAATFAAKAFLKHIGWTATGRQTVSANWNAPQKMIEAKLPSRFVSGDAPRIREQQAGSDIESR